MNRNAVTVLTVCLMVGSFASGAYFAAPEAEHQNANIQEISEVNMPGMAIGPLEIKSGNIRGESLESMQAAIAELRQEILQLKADIAAVSVVEATERNADAQQIDNIKQQQMMQNEEEHENFQKVAAYFSEQRTDANWAADATKRIEAALYDQKPENLNIDHIECHTSICKLEMHELNDNGMAVFNNEFRQQIVDVFGAGMMGKDESGKTIVYVAKNYEDISGR